MSFPLKYAILKKECRRAFRTAVIRTRSGKLLQDQDRRKTDMFILLAGGLLVIIVAVIVAVVSAVASAVAAESDTPE